jgi:F-type H+-transporting ATPase subunit beta
MMHPPEIVDSGSRAGRVVAVHGSVIDVRFPAGALPAIDEAVLIDWDGGAPLISEVHQHLDPATVRAVALQNTTGLKRGTPVRALGAPISVPVGNAVLGRLLNALGEPADLKGAFPANIERRPIHAPAPPLDRQGGNLEIFHTGVQVDVDFGDLLDFFAMDRATRAILLYAHAASREILDMRAPMHPRR